MKDRSIRTATRRVALAAVAAALLPATAFGGRTTVEVGEGVPDAHEQRVLAGVLLEAVEGQVPPEQRGAWRELLLERIEAADPLNLRIAAESPDPGQALAALAGAVDPRDPLSPLEIGSPTRDLSFTPLEPCRLVDTRITGAAIAADTSRVFAGFSILGFQGQGGANWNCGIPSGVVALSLNVTVVEPGGRGFATAYPAHVVRPTASTVNYEPGVNLSNESIVRLSPGLEFRVYSRRSIDLVVDVTGYFIMPQATALQCLTETANVTIAAGATGFVDAACPGWYTMTGGGCLWQGAAFAGPVHAAFPGNVASQTYTCQARNETATARPLIARVRCCRVPGR